MCSYLSPFTDWLAERHPVSIRYHVKRILPPFCSASSSFTSVNWYPFVVCIVRYAQLIDCIYNNNLVIIVLWGLRGSLEPVLVVTLEHSYCRWMYIDFFEEHLTFQMAWQRLAKPRLDEQIMVVENGSFEGKILQTPGGVAGFKNLKSRKEDGGDSCAVRILQLTGNHYN